MTVKGSILTTDFYLRTGNKACTEQYNDMEQQIPNESPAMNERFTANDIDFIYRVFGKELVSQEDLYYILDNQHLRQPLLDSRCLFDAITSVDPVPQVSPYFYYYILVRQVMLESGLEDPRLTGKATLSLEEMARMQEMAEGRNPGEAVENHPTFKMIVVCKDLEDRRKVYIRAHLGLFGMIFEGYSYRSEIYHAGN